MLLLSRICRVFTVLALTWHVSRVALREGMENASSEEHPSCFHSARAHLACPQSEYRIHVKQPVGYRLP